MMSWSKTKYGVIIPIPQVQEANKSWNTIIII